MSPQRLRTPRAPARLTPQPLGAQPCGSRTRGPRGPRQQRLHQGYGGLRPPAGLDRGPREPGAAPLGDGPASTRTPGRGTWGPDRGSARLGAPRGGRCLRRRGHTWPVCVTFSPVGEVRTPKHLAPPGSPRVTAPPRPRSLRKVTAAAILPADLRPRAPTRRRTRTAPAEPAPPGRSRGGEARVRGAAGGRGGGGAPPGKAGNCAPVAWSSGLTYQGQGREGGSGRCSASLRR